MQPSTMIHIILRNKTLHFKKEVLKLEGEDKDEISKINGTIR